MFRIFYRKDFFFFFFKGANAIENRISPNYEQSYLILHPLLVPLYVTLLIMLMCVSVLLCDSAWNVTNQHNTVSQPDSVI